MSVSQFEQSFRILLPPSHYIDCADKLVDNYDIIRIPSAPDKNIHSVKLCFEDTMTIKHILDKARLLKEFEAARIYINYVGPYYSRRENNRLIINLNKSTLLGLHKGDDIKIQKGKLYHNNMVVDQFDIAKLLDKSYMDEYDIIFIPETHSSRHTLLDISGFHKVVDPLFNASKHDGIVAYIKTRLYSDMTNLRFSKCSLSFSLSSIPQFFFILVYMYPVDSLNFKLGTLSEDILFLTNRGITPFIGGDLNTSLDDINALSQNAVKWRYTKNADTVINTHGKQVFASFIKSPH